MSKTDPLFWLTLLFLSLSWVCRILLIPLPANDSFANIAFNAVIRGLFFLLPFLIWVMYRKHKLKEDFALHWPQIMGLFWAGLYLIGLLDYELILKRSFHFTNDVYLLMNVPFAPIIEELVYRGVVMTYLLERGSMVRAILFSTALFVVAHWPGWILYSHLSATEFLTMSFQVGYFGAAMGYVRYSSKSVFPSIVVHIVNNFLSFGRV